MKREAEEGWGPLIPVDESDEVESAVTDDQRNNGQFQSMIALGVVAALFLVEFHNPYGQQNGRLLPIGPNQLCTDRHREASVDNRRLS